MYVADKNCWLEETPDNWLRKILSVSISSWQLEIVDEIFSPR